MFLFCPRPSCQVLCIFYRHDRLSEPTLSYDSSRGNYLKCGTICELSNSPSALEMLRDFALYKFTIDIDIDNDNNNRLLNEVFVDSDCTITYI